MAVTPEDELHEAKSRLGSDKEIDHRNAARIAYYAAFHALQNLVAELKVILKFDGGDHAQVIQQLLASTDINYRSLSYMLKDCRGRRTDADYQMDRDFPRSEAELQIACVERIFDRLNEMGHADLIKKAPKKTSR